MRSGRYELTLKYKETKTEFNLFSRSSMELEKYKEEGPTRNTVHGR